MFDCRTNRTPIERLGSIGFWFGFVRLTTPGFHYRRIERYTVNLRKLEQLESPKSTDVTLIKGAVSRPSMRSATYKFVSYFQAGRHRCFWESRRSPACHTSEKEFCHLIF